MILIHVHSIELDSRYPVRQSEAIRVASINSVRGSFLWLGGT